MAYYPASTHSNRLRLRSRTQPGNLPVASCHYTATLTGSSWRTSRLTSGQQQSTPNPNHRSKWMRLYKERTGQALAVCLLSFIVPLSAADNLDLATPESVPAQVSATSPQLISEIEQMKQMLADQQRQINELRQ